MILQFSKKFCFLIVIGANFFQFSECVDRSKFRKCSDTGFCKRYRGRSLNTDILYQIDASSIRKEENNGKIVATLSGGPSGSSPLNLEVSLYTAGSIRVRITENTPRWQPTDILIPQALHAAKLDLLPSSDARIPPSVRARPEKTYVALSVGESSVLVLQTSPAPLLVELFQDGEPLVSANGRSLLHFETRRTKTDSARHLSDSKEDRHKGKEVVDYGEDGLAIYADGSREEKQEGAVVESADERGEWEESFNGHSDRKPSGPMSVGLDFAFPGAKYLYGIPEHASSLVLQTTAPGEGQGQGAHYSDPYRMYNLDVFEYELDEPMALYGNIPFLLAHGKNKATGLPHSAGLFWFNPSETFIDVARDKSADNSKAPHTHWISESGLVDFFLFAGHSPKEVMAQFTALVGRQQLPPLFALGYHQCRWNYRDEKDVASVDSMFEQLDYPYDVIWLDIEHTDGKRYFTWDRALFPHPEAMQKNISAHGRKMVTIIDPHIKRDDNYAIHKEATAKGLYVRKADNTGDFDGWCWPGSSSYLDFTSPVVREWWGSRFSLDKYTGSTMDLFTWNDMNEPSVFNGPEVSMPKDALSLAGVEHREWHNLYGIYMHQATSEGLTARDPKKALRPFVLSRAFWAGSQRFGAIWTGDNQATWEHLRIAAPMLLSINVAGLSFCGADVGGFFGEPDAELFTRWYQAGAFTPFFRGHAHHDTKRREPWVFGEPYTTIMRSVAMVRYSLLPYWYTVFFEAYSSGVPVMRPMFTEFPDDENVWTVDDQWMVGEALLVKPVTEQGGKAVDIIFPGSQGWYDLYSMKSLGISAPKMATVQAPLEKIPVFVRGGHIVPRKMRLRRSSKLMYYDPYTLVVAPDSKGSATGLLYLDDEHTLAHETGKAFAVRRFLFLDGSLKCFSDSASGQYDTVNTVERVVVAGQKSPPKRVLLTEYSSEKTAGTPKELVFAYDKENAVVTIKKPDVLVGSDWEISLEQ